MVTVDRSLFHAETYKEAKSNIDKIVSQINSEQHFIRKVIFIRFQTSESPRGNIGYESDEHLYDGVGFSINCYIAEEYEFKSGLAFDKAQLVYKIIEVSPNSRRAISSRPNILGQTFSGDKVRLLPYSENLYSFLNSLADKVKQLNDNLISFFDEDPEKFLNNVRDSAHKLLK
jgi:hypothetical protein